MKIKCLTILMSLSLAAVGPRAVRAQAGTENDKWDARIESVEGEVYVQISENEPDSWSQAETGMPLESGDRIKSGDSGSAEIALSDGGVIQLGSDSEMEIRSLAHNDTVFSVTLGSFIAKIKHFIESSRKMSVRTPTAVAAVRGTEFAVEYSPENDETYVGVYDEGKVAVASSEPDGKETVVEKGSEAVVKRGVREIRLRRMVRLAVHRARLRRARARLVLVARRWKKMDPAKRQELRRRIAAKRVINREQLRQILKKRREIIKNRRSKIRNRR